MASSGIRIYRDGRVEDPSNANSFLANIGAPCKINMNMPCGAIGTNIKRYTKLNNNNNGLPKNIWQAMFYKKMNK